MIFVWGVKMCIFLIDREKDSKVSVCGTNAIFGIESTAVNAHIVCTLSYQGSPVDGNI